MAAPRRRQSSWSRRTVAASGALALALGATGCAMHKDRGASEVQDLSDTYGWFVAGSDVQNRLLDADARPQSFADCGHELGSLKLFEDPANDRLVPAGWRDDRVWRRYARPVAGASGCEAGETYDAGGRTCWRSYGLQFYPSSPATAGNRVRVPGASPVMRALPKDGYPTRESWCRFDGDTALVWVAGVNNRGLGLTWSRVDNELVASLLAWNRNAAFPPAVTGADGPGHRKLKGPPAYFQIVQNDNAPAGGITGNHSEVAINSMAANFELAYRAGIKHLEVVTHSNGVVTAQLAFGLFVHAFSPGRWNEVDWVGPAFSDAAVRDVQAKRRSLLADRAASGAPEQMTVNFYHLQAAPSQRWGNDVLDRFGFYSDLAPTAKWVRKSSLGVSYWGWDWYTPAYYEEASRYVKPEFRFYYNAADWMTYDYYRYSSVGRRESMPWQAELRDHLQVGARPQVIHYHCPSSAAGVCGPGHEQADSLWYFSSPAMPDTARPAPWAVD